MNPYFITIEGIDGSGKTTQARLLYEFLKGKGINCILTSEPTKEGIYGIQLRKMLKDPKSDPVKKAELFALDRKEHAQKVITPSLKNKITVICDRYLHSSLAYQPAEGVPKEFVEKLNKDIPKPNITFYIDVSALEGRDRIIKRNGESEMEEYEKKLAYQEKVRNNYLSFKGQKGYYIINGERPIQEIFDEIKAIIERILPT